MQELDLENLTDNAKESIAAYMYRRERESAYLHGVLPEALAQWKRIRAEEKTGESATDVGGERYDIIIDGTIVSDEAKETSSEDAGMVSPSDIKAQIEDMAPEADSVRVIINSPGGNVFAAVIITDMINDLNMNTSVRIRGVAASAGAYIALAVSDELTSAPGSKMMLHGASANGWNRMDLMKIDDLLKGTNVGFEKIIRDSTNLSDDVIAKVFENDVWFTTDEMYDAGITTSKPEPAAKRKKKKKDYTAEAALDKNLGEMPKGKLSKAGMSALARSRMLFFAPRSTQ